ncbi:MAG: hypothetical protein OIF57_16390 [Marinobacterium sp.]|nr:hypothetical protein [Marinobacterium sp.]
MQLRQLVNDIKDIRTIPRLDIDLDRSSTANNVPFFYQAVEAFYCSATKRHPRFPFIRFLQYGVAINTLPENHAAYLQTLEPSARRNIRKSQRMGYQFARIQYNDHLTEIGEIHRSAPVRQGPMSASLLQQNPLPINDPASQTTSHDYPYFGVFKDGQLTAYAGCLVAGEMLLLATVFGHSDHQKNGVVPLLITGIADYIYTNHPGVKFYIYDTYYGASPSLRRFKKKFGFNPTVVQWHF